MNKTYCPSIHGGISINLTKDGRGVVKPCCEIFMPMVYIDSLTQPIFDHPEFLKRKQANDQNQWDQGCNGCRAIEESGGYSYRQSQIDRFGTSNNKEHLAVLDLMYDTSCNLACRTCGPASSTYWQKHLKDNNIKLPAIQPQSHQNLSNTVLNTILTQRIKTVDQVKLSGGEPLMNPGYWNLLEQMINQMPGVFTNSELHVQTNGTHSLSKVHQNIFSKFRLVRISFSIDGIQSQFEYLRWPALWSQATDNILKMRDTAPSNVMFNFEETISIFNLFNRHRLPEWIANNIPTNRDGDPVIYNMHLAHGDFSVQNLSNEYAAAINYKFLPNNFVENHNNICAMIDKINQFDNLRQQNWLHAFPELAEFYIRFI